MNDDTSPEVASRPPKGPARRVLPALLATALLAAGALAAVSARREGPVVTTPPADTPPDLAREATDYLRGRKPVPLSGPLQTLLADPAKAHVPTEPHPLLNQPAPPFALLGVDGQVVESADLLARGPVVLVFYYGYSCNHCVSQLFDLNEDLRYFTELGATVVAVSPDMPERTRTQYAKYGAFAFPVLSDKNRSVAGRYGVYRPAAGKDPEWEAHGTFVIARDGRVRWAITGAEPFTGNPTLLFEVARLENRLPASDPNK